MEKKKKFQVLFWKPQYSQGMSLAIFLLNKSNPAHHCVRLIFYSGMESFQLLHKSQDTISYKNRVLLFKLFWFN